MKTIEERMEEVKKIMSGGGMRFTKPLKAGTLKNRDVCGVITGYSFQIDNLSYRGIWVSTIESLKLTVDGEEVPQEWITFEVHGMKIPLRDLGGHTEVFWGAEDEGIVNVSKLNGLAAGEHTFSIELVRRNDFGHTVGNGTDGYEEATEFTHPGTVTDTAVFTI